MPSKPDIKIVSLLEQKETQVFLTCSLFKYICMHKLVRILETINGNTELKNMGSLSTPNDNNISPVIRSCDKETLQPVFGTITGIIPSWLQGELVRVGPGIKNVGKDHFKHVFDGLAILHKFTIKEGKVTYQNRALQSDTYKKNMAANRIVVTEFGTRALPDPCQGIFGRLKSEFKSIFDLVINEVTDNCSVNLAYYGDQLYAMTESNFVRRLKPDTLETLGEKTNISDFIAVNSATAHPHILGDGTIINIGNNYRHWKGPHYSILKIPPSFNSQETSFVSAKIIAEIPSRWRFHTGYFHSFGITNTRKLILIETPFCMNLLGIIAGGWTKRSYSEWLKWNSDQKTRFYVVNLENGKVSDVIYETENLFLFHHINAYEDDNEQIVVDVAGYNDAEWVSQMHLKDTSKLAALSPQSSARRYVLPLDIENATSYQFLLKSNELFTKASATLRCKTHAKTYIDVMPHHLTSSNIELPRINYKYNGARYKFFYGLHQAKHMDSFDFGMDVISKVNVETGQMISWTATQEDGLASEAVFVQNSVNHNPEEDDGVILSVLLTNTRLNSVSLLILNAKDMEELGRVEFTAAGIVTGTAHGSWVQSGENIHAF